MASVVLPSSTQFTEKLVCWKRFMNLIVTTQEESDSPCTLEKGRSVHILEEYHLLITENSINAPANNNTGIY